MNKKVLLIVICLLCAFVFWCESQENNDSNICTTWNECINDLWDESDIVDQTYREVEDESDNSILDINEPAPIAEVLNEETIVSAWTRDD